MTLLLQDSRSLVRQVILRELQNAKTLKVTLDNRYIVRQVRSLYSVEVDSTEAASLLCQEAPAFGFKDSGDDSRGRVQWQASNPRYIVCPRHRVRAVLRPYLEGKSFSLRAIHSHRGRHYACRVSSLRISYLVRVMPRVETLLRDYLQRNPCLAGDLEKAGGGE